MVRSAVSLFGARLSLFLVLVLSLGVVWAPAAFAQSEPLAPASGAAFASNPEVDQSAPERYRLSLTLSEPLDHRVFVLSGPDRIVVDFPELSWRIPGAARDAVLGGEISGMRYGLFRVGRSRLVVDLTQSASVTDHGVVTNADGSSRFFVDFRVDSGTQRSMQAPAQTGMLDSPTVGAVPPAAALRPTPRPRRFVVALDPGHGGRDPGATYGGVAEKELVLGFAKRLASDLRGSSLIDVVFTRSTDVFVTLEDRVLKARAAGADLFLSIHADAIRNPDVSGASVYTLSPVASDTLAAELAEKENAADALAGVAMLDQEDDVRLILLDLARRARGEQSERLAGLLVSELAQKVPVLPKRPHRRAGFKVLKTFDTPSVLIELGFLTNVRDRRRLTNPAWQEKAAAAIAKAVRRWQRGDQSGFVEASSQQ